MIYLLLVCVCVGNYFPQHSFLLHKEGFTISYDGRTKNAVWVYETLTKGDLSARKRCCFTIDRNLPEPVRSHLADFLESGYDRGHLCPYADRRDCSTYLLSNVSPQIPDFNQGLWKRLEEYVRSLTGRFDAVHVITLPLFLADAATRRVSYEVLGEHRVAVPTHFCKVIYAEKGAQTEVYVYVIPHRPLPKESPLALYRIGLDELERLSGIVFQRVSTK
jgi:endonuclease G